MKGRNKRLLEGVRAFSPILQAYEAGYSKEDIHTSILEALKPEFYNIVQLEKYSIDLLAVEAINVTKIRINDFASRIYDLCMVVRRKLLVNDENICAEIYSQWEEPIAKALSLYWNAVMLEHHKVNLPIDEYAYELFRNIGSLIEGTLQVYLKELLHITLFAEGEKVSYSEIASLSLGKVVQKLNSKLGSSELFTLSPWMVPLNQWRNIAQHYSVDTMESSIICKYGTNNQYTIKLERAELMEVARALVLLYSAVRTSHSIFVLDNAYFLQAYSKGLEKKDSDAQFQFCVGAASQGFEVIEMKIEENIAFADFIDVTENNSLERALQASVFIYNLWIITKSPKVTVKYSTKSGDKSLITTAKSADCEKIYSGEKEFSYLAEVVEYQLEKHINKFK